jgi:hypothetical protein
VTDPAVPVFRKESEVSKVVDPAAIETLNGCVAVLFAASSTRTVNELVPDPVGVPDITPVDAARLNPAGNDPELTLQL